MSRAIGTHPPYGFYKNVTVKELACRGVAKNVRGKELVEHGDRATGITAERRRAGRNQGENSRNDF
jgi:hypothetical protein